MGPVQSSGLGSDSWKCLGFPIQHQYLLVTPAAAPQRPGGPLASNLGQSSSKWEGREERPGAGLALSFRPVGDRLRRCGPGSSRSETREEARCWSLRPRHWPRVRCRPLGKLQVAQARLARSPNEGDVGSWTSDVGCWIPKDVPCSMDERAAPREQLRAADEVGTSANGGTTLYLSHTHHNHHRSRR